MTFHDSPLYILVECSESPEAYFTILIPNDTSYRVFFVNIYTDLKSRNKILSTLLE